MRVTLVRSDPRCFSGSDARVEHGDLPLVHHAVGLLISNASQRRRPVLRTCDFIQFDAGRTDHGHIQGWVARQQRIG